jgi:hypothetical protein
MPYGIQQKQQHDPRLVNMICCGVCISERLLYKNSRVVCFGKIFFLFVFKIFVNDLLTTYRESAGKIKKLT